MWFVAALLAFTVAYAALRCVRPAARPRPLRPGLLGAAALVIAVSSFAVWQRWPVTGDAFLNLRWGEWPQGAVLFALGVHGAEAGWLAGFPPVLARRLGWVAAAGVAALMTVMLYLVLARGEDQALAMSADLPTMVFALLDGVVAVTGTLWFVSWLRHRWPARGPLLGKAAQASYATYVTHPLVLTAIMVAFSSVALAPEIKFVLVAAAPAIPGCRPSSARVAPGMAEARALALVTGCPGRPPGRCVAARPGGPPEGSQVRDGSRCRWR
jgi:Acyltransferase family